MHTRAGTAVACLPFVPPAAPWPNASRKAVFMPPLGPSQAWTPRPDYMGLAAGSRGPLSLAHLPGPDGHRVMPPAGGHPCAVASSQFPGLDLAPGWGQSRRWRPETGAVLSSAQGQGEEEQALLGVAPLTHGPSLHGRKPCPRLSLLAPAAVGESGVAGVRGATRGLAVSEGLWSPHVTGLGRAGPVRPGPRQRLTSWCSEASPRL